MTSFIVYFLNPNNFWNIVTIDIINQIIYF